MQLKYRRFLLHIKKIFIVTVSKHWHKLLREVVEFLCLERFKSHLNMVLGKQVYVALLEQGCPTRLPRGSLPTSAIL